MAPHGICKDGLDSYKLEFNQAADDRHLQTLLRPQVVRTVTSATECLALCIDRKIPVKIWIIRNVINKDP